MTESKALEIVKETKRIVADKEFQREHVKEKDRDFTRTRKLTFTKTAYFVLGNTRESLEFASEAFVESSGIEEITPAALCKARAKIDYRAFKEVFESCARLMPVSETYQGYQVIAIDGMKGEMPNLKSLKESYPVHKKANYPQFHAIAAYDVLNEYFMAADFLPAPSNEHKMASHLLECPIFSEGKRIFLFDRGFPSVALIQTLNQMEHKFVMRVSKSFLSEVNDFWNSKFIDKTIKISYSGHRGATNRVSAELPYDFTLRCVRIRLIDGTDEICITNLAREQFSAKKIKKLYGLRWGIETSFNFLKNDIFIEEFTSKKENGILQDFYASLWAANLIEASIIDADSLIQKKEN